MRRQWAWLLGKALRPQVAIFHRFQASPYGGSNQFLIALRKELRRRGLRVAANLIADGTRACLLNAFAFDEDRLQRMRRPECRIVQRVDGPVAAYRGVDSGVDLKVAQINREFAEATIFQSRYSQEAHRALGLEFRCPVVIMNAVDSDVFHPRGRLAWDPSRKIRLISISWSDNLNKGASTYKWIEDHLDWGRFDYTFVGRSPLRYERIRMIPPVGSAKLAELLRQHDIYVTASLNDPCSNALIEGLSCGLPAVYARSGGHPELVGAGGLAFDEPEDIPDLLERLAHDYERYQAAIRAPDLSEVATRYLEVLGVVAGQAPGEALPQTSA